MRFFDFDLQQKRPYIVFSQESIISARKLSIHSPEKPILSTGKTRIVGKLVVP
jgi:hypothetical protein